MFVCLFWLVGWPSWVSIGRLSHPMFEPIWSASRPGDFPLSTSRPWQGRFMVSSWYVIITKYFFIVSNMSYQYWLFSASYSFLICIVHSQAWVAWASPSCGPLERCKAPCTTDWRTGWRGLVASWVSPWLFMGEWGSALCICWACGGILWFPILSACSSS